MRSDFLSFIKRIVFLFVFFQGLAIHFAWSQDRWFLNFTPGLSLVPPAPLEIEQKGAHDISIWAKYRTFPLRLPLYYSYTGGYTRGNRLYEIEMNHLKIYLQNTSEQVEWFAVSHGYNQIFFNTGTMNGKISHKTGIGMVLAHPENTVNGKSLNPYKGLFGRGYYPAGIAAQYVYYKEFHAGKFLYLLVEAKASVGYAVVKVVDGRASVPVAALHFLVGPGFKIKKGTPAEVPPK